ncbi:hypothetical protein GGR57DRAFT_512135 [Xylariaceae sp. FL1272]|nr:hypothetical protein GGR57DRAFT_512135 [Xylariaceae sp. FL1272]
MLKTSTSARAAIGAQRLCRGMAFSRPRRHLPAFDLFGADENTSMASVIIEASFDHVCPVDGAPCSAAIEDGVKMTMSSWTLYPALSDSNMNGLSKKSSQNELRSPFWVQVCDMTDAIEPAGRNAVAPDPDHQSVSVLSVARGYGYESCCCV